MIFQTILVLILATGFKIHDTAAFLPLHQSPCRSSSLASLKPAAIPLMDSGKALAAMGEELIDFTRDNDCYGGPLSSAGAQIRNAGDCIAQAAASCRFKTGRELVIDELREAATCVGEATLKLQVSVEEEDLDPPLQARVDAMIDGISNCGQSLESTGAAILRGSALPQVGACLSTAGDSLQSLEMGFVSQSAGERSQRAASLMLLAGNNLQGIEPPKPSGRAFLKGGGL